MQSLMQRGAGWGLVMAVTAALWAAPAHPAQTPAPAELRVKFEQLEAAHSPDTLKAGLHIISVERPDMLQGDVYALLDHPYAKVSAELTRPEAWCDIMLLHVNIKACAVIPGGDGTRLSVNIGMKEEQTLDNTQRAVFDYRNATVRADLAVIRLQADEGPMGTRDYRIALAITPVGTRATLMHMRYTYAYAFAGKLAMKTYLATAGANKVGFTTESDASGTPSYVRGVRGAVERNTMRYFLAVEAYLAALQTPADARLEQRLNLWFDGTERYSRQLRELNRDVYLKAKRSEYRRTP